MEANTLNLPVLALRGLTVFPHTNLTFDVERRISIKALEVAMESGQEIFLVTQRELNTDRPGEKDLYTMGTISRVTQILRLGKTSLRVMVEGGRRARLRRLWQTEPYLQGHVEVVEESAAVSHGPKTEALLRQIWADKPARALLRKRAQTDPNRLMALPYRACFALNSPALLAVFCQLKGLRQSST